MRDDQSEILNVLRDEAFERLTSAIRGSTVAPHINRERRKRGETTEVYPYQVNYDLTASLVSAAERGPDDFLREFYSFAARYNDETARPQKMTRPGEPAVSDEKTGARKYGRALLRANDLTQLAVWMRDRSLRELVPYALVAFGTSRKTMTTAGDVDTPTAGADTSEHEEDAEE